MKKIAVPLIILILLTNCILAAPSVPQGFNGNIIVKDGSNPNGKLLIGYVNGIATGQAVIKNGKFDIVVTDNLGKGGKVEFKIGTEKAKETFTFNFFEVITTNLTFNTLSGINPCGNEICEIGECSKCAIDCGINDCLNNGRCDIEIGEDCANAPSDCGICLYCGDRMCNNGESCSTCSNDCGACSITTTSSSGGGGGSSSISSSSNSNSSSNNVTQTSAKSSGDSELSDLSIITLNEKNKKINSKFGITGNSVVDFAKSKIGIGLMIVLVVVLALGVMKLRSKSKPQKWKKH